MTHDTEPEVHYDKNIDIDHDQVSDQQLQPQTEDCHEPQVDTITNSNNVKHSVKETPI
jgi:hypothetical protein